MYNRKFQIIFVFVFLVLTVLSSPINKVKDNPKIHVIKKKCFNNNYKKNVTNEVDTSIGSEPVKEIPIENEKLIGDISSFNWDITPEEIDTMCTKSINKLDAIVKKLLLVPDEDCSFESIFAPLFYVENEVENVQIFMYSGLIRFAKNPNSRIAAQNCYQFLYNTKYMYLYQIAPKGMKVIENIYSGKFSYPEDPDDIQLINTILSLLNTNENTLPLQTKLNNIVNEFMDCLTNDKTSITFTKSELEGLSESMLNEFEKTTKDGEEAYIININNNNSNNILYYAKNENVRRTYNKIKNTICEPNVERMKEIINIRTAIAKESGFETFSDYEIKDYMAKDLKTVLEFINDIKEKVQPIFKKHLNKYLELKNKEKAKYNETVSNELNRWDINYYINIFKEEELNFSEKDVIEYFPTDKVFPEIIKIFEELYSLKIVKTENISVWHEDVEPYNVYDKKTNEYIGTILLDLYEREGKSIQGSTFQLSDKVKIGDGSEASAFVIVSTSFHKSTTSAPALASIETIKAFLHEFGHALHLVNVKMKWVVNSINQKSDFLEIPALMQENFIYEPSILERISHHYKDNNKKIPKELIDAIVKSKNIDFTYTIITILFYSLGDIKLYSKGEIDKDFDIVKFWNDIARDVYMVNTDEYWDFATMVHFANEMPSSYYSYLWSMVYAQDLFSKISENGITNPEIGLKYRENVLELASFRGQKDRKSVV